MSEYFNISYINLYSVQNTTKSLYITFIVALIVWYFQFLWNRRKLYKYSSKVQGPISFPVFGSAHYFFGNSGDIYENVMYIMRNYPEIGRVWLGHKLFYAITKPEYLEILFNSQNSLAKDELYKYAEPLVSYGLFTAPVPVWKRHRKIIMPTLNQRILDSFVDVFVEQSNVFVENIKKQCGKEDIDIFKYISQCTLSIICETFMGVKVDLQNSESKFGALIDKCLEIMFLRMFLIHYHSDFIFNMTKHSKEFYEAINELHTFSEKIIAEKREEFENRLKDNAISASANGKRKAFLDYLLEVSNQEGQIFTNEELRGEVFTFLVAGSDTTATSNCFTLLLLAMHPEVQQKVYEEVLDVVGPDRNLDANDLPQLKYLERVIKESLRLFPVGAFVARAITQDIDLKDGNILPNGSSVVLGIMYIHRSEIYWPDPLKFDPDRFLPENCVKRHPCTYIPFAYGPRNCAGIRYGMMAMKSLLATVIRSYRVKTKYSNIEEVKLKTNLVLRPKNGYKLSFEKRN